MTQARDEGQWEAAEICGRILHIPCSWVSWSRNERRCQWWRIVLLQIFIEHQELPNLCFWPRLLPALGPGTQQGTDINIWWTEMKKSRWVCLVGGTIFPGLYPCIVYQQILEGGSEKKSYHVPCWSKVRSWERAETETRPYRILPVRKPGREGRGGRGTHTHKMPRMMDTVLGLWCQEIGCQCQLCLLTQSLPFMAPSFPSENREAGSLKRESVQL